MNLSTRARNLLNKNRITDDGLKLLDCSADWMFRNFKNCGQQTASEIWNYRQYLIARDITLVRNWDFPHPHVHFGDWHQREAMYRGSDGRTYRIVLKSRCEKNHPDVIPARIKAGALHKFTPARYDHVCGYGVFYL